MNVIPSGSSRYSARYRFAGISPLVPTVKAYVDVFTYETDAVSGGQDEELADARIEDSTANLQPTWGTRRGLRAFTRAQESSSGQSHRSSCKPSSRPRTAGGSRSLTRCSRSSRIQSLIVGSPCSDFRRAARSSSSVSTLRSPASTCMTLSTASSGQTTTCRGSQGAPLSQAHEEQGSIHRRCSLHAEARVPSSDSRGDRRWRNAQCVPPARSGVRLPRRIPPQL